jgi:hypothetical protein
MAETSSTPPAGQAAPTEGDQKEAGTVDIQKLVEKVYQLMQADLRLERARRGLANERQR